jgi:hypothetical protein
MSSNIIVIIMALIFYNFAEVGLIALKNSLILSILMAAFWHSSKICLLFSAIYITTINITALSDQLSDYTKFD